MIMVKCFLTHGLSPAVAPQPLQLVQYPSQYYIILRMTACSRTNQAKQKLKTSGRSVERSRHVSDVC